MPIKYNMLNELNICKSIFFKHKHYVRVKNKYANALVKQYLSQNENQSNKN